MKLDAVGKLILKKNLFFQWCG